MAKKLVRIGRSKTGLGLFAITEIPKRTIIVYYRGKRIPTPHANSAETRDARYMFEINKRWTIDGSSRRNLGRYANHSCRPNAESDIVRGKIFLRAIKPIQSGDEITYDYGKEYFDLFIRSKGCRCAGCDEKKHKGRAADKKAPPRKTGRNQKTKSRLRRG